MTPKNPHQRVSPFLRCILFAILFCCGQYSFAQPQPADTSKKILLASVEKKTNNYFIKEANVQYPEILKGNEDHMADYMEGFCVRRKEYLIRMYNKGKVLLPKAAAILKKHDLPEELKVLLTLESAYNGNAVSKAGAVGYWQFMDAVAREYGLKYATREKKIIKKKIIKVRGKKVVVEKVVSKKTRVRQKDDRKNFNKATVAAARYLHDRRRNLDDNWLLVVASYNCGVGNVWSAMERSGVDEPTFWDIKNYLPRETQAYVMNFITLNVIFANYDNFLKDNLTFKPVKIELPDNGEQYMGGVPIETDAVELR